ncbi:hypothetical protein D3C72_461210 [compost metagenome]
MGLTYRDSFDVTMVLILIGIIAVYLFVNILYILTLRNTFKAISEQNRTMAPNNTWLLLIPVFNLVWSFIVVNNLSESILKESKLKSFPLSEANPANGTGIAMSVLRCTTVVPLLGFFSGLAAVICWIIYWVQINNYKKAIQAAPYNGTGNDSVIFKF